MALKIASGGRIIIPAALRRKYDLTPGSFVEIVDYGGVLALVPQYSDPVEAAAGMLAGETSLIQALLREHEQAYENE